MQLFDKSKDTHSENHTDFPKVKWINPEDNPWRIPLLDLRPFTLNMLSTSLDPQYATNAISFLNEDGTSFIGQKPRNSRKIKAKLRYKFDRYLADGVLFVPKQMEEKWALFYHKGTIICVRSWTRQVQVVASIELYKDSLEIIEITGMFGPENEPSELTIRLCDYLLRSHALQMDYPVPLPTNIQNDPDTSTMWCFSMFGNKALFATPNKFDRLVPERPLRTHSLLHIATARGDISAIKKYLAAGIPVDLLAGDGLAPLHWALVPDSTEIMMILLKNGTSVDVRSDAGATPLMNAAQSGNLKKVSFLLDHGADVNAHDMRGFTSLHRAAEVGYVEILKLLLEHGAEIEPIAQGFTPRMLAEKNNRKEIIDFLDLFGSPHI